MEQTKILVFGGQGYIGNMMLEYWAKHHPEQTVVVNECRANNFKEVMAEIAAKKPTHVLSLLGRTSGWIGDKFVPTIDYLEYPDKLRENLRDNLQAIMVLSNACQRQGVHFTYLGTGCIFDYDGKEHPWEQETNGFKESDLPQFFGSQYSVVKGITDQLMELYEDSALTLRIRMPISSQLNKRNFITKIVAYEKICNVANSMTVLETMFPVLEDMLRNKKVGKYNLTNPGLICHNEILGLYKEIIDPEFTWKNFTLEEQATVLNCGRSNNYLDTAKIEKEYPAFPNIKDAVRKTMHEIKAFQDASKE